MTKPNQSKIATILATSAVASFCVGLAGKQGASVESVTVSKSYHSADLGSIDSVGGCKATPDTINCWNADGKPDADLAEKVKAFYIVQGNQELHFKFGRKNRLVVFRLTDAGENRMNASNPTTPQGQYLQQAGRLGDYGGDREPHLEWFSIDADPAVETASVQFQFNIALGNATIPLKEGAEAQVGQMRVRIDSIKSAPDQPGWNGDSNIHQRAWSVLLSVSGMQGSKLPILYGRPFDQKGQQIYRVDASGNPIVQKNTRRTSQYGMGPAQGFDASSGTSVGTSLTTQVLSLPVNPSKVGTLALNASGTRKVTITDIPLDPK